MRFKTTINYLIKRKIATAVLITASVAASATLGDGGKKAGKTSGLSLERTTARSFSLRASYGNFKGANLFKADDEKKFIMLNTVVTYQKGNTTYVVPLKKRVILDKVKFNPAPLRF